MFQNYESYFLLFITYAFIGWLLEVLVKLIENKRFINRGFLIGPYLPIYGFGALLITLLLQKYSNDLIVLFVLSMIICSILEYFTSFIMEKLFKTRWWDYSSKKFNINGRIYLGTMIPFGILGVVMMKFINPFLLYICNLFDDGVLYIITIILLIIFLIDCVISTIILLSVRKENSILSGDNTERMSRKVYAILKQSGWIYRRLLKAFPNMYDIEKFINSSKKNVLVYIDNKKKKYERKRKKLIDKSNIKLNKLKNKYSNKMNKIKNKNIKKQKRS